MLFYKDEAECLLIKAKNAKAPQMESMQHVSRSGEKGGPFVSTNGGK